MQTQMSPRVTEYLEARGYDVETIVKLNLSSVSRKRGSPPAPHECVVIPYVQRGKVVATKLRDLDATERKQHWFWEKPETTKLTLWNRDVIADQTLSELPLIITEGEWDAFTAIEAGFPRTVSVPAGANDRPGENSGDERERPRATHAYIDEAFDDLKRCAVIIIATDNDSAGQNLQDDLIARFGKARCKIAEYPDDCKDLNDVLKKHGIAEVRNVINRAKYFPVDDVVSLFEIPRPGPLEVHKLRGLGRDFYERVGFCRGQVSFWTGYAGRGKTTVLMNVLHGAVREWGWRVGGSFFEDNVWRTFEPAMSRIYHGKESLSTDERRESQKWMHEWFKFAIPKEDGDKRLDWFLDRADVCVKRFGCRLLVLDPWTQLNLEFSRSGGSETTQIGKYIDKCTEFAERTQCHLAITAHPTKPDEDRDRIPDLYSISGSAHFMNKAFLGVSVHSYDDMPGVTDVHVSKVKIIPEMGRRGRFSLRFDSASRRLSEMSASERKFIADDARINSTSKKATRTRVAASEV
jgi:twinkle protein